MRVFRKTYGKCRLDQPKADLQISIRRKKSENGTKQNGELARLCTTEQVMQLMTGLLQAQPLVRQGLVVVGGGEPLGARFPRTPKQTYLR